MSSILYGSFFDINDHEIKVEIKTNNTFDDIEIGGNQIQFSSDPIEIKTSCDSLFEHIIETSCTITLVSKIYLGNILYSTNPRDIEVRVYNNDTCMFYGYVQPQTFSQPYAYEDNEVDIECVGYLSTIDEEYIINHGNFSDLRSSAIVNSFSNILSMILPTYTYWDNSKIVASESALATCGVSLSAWIKEDEDEIPSNKEILEDILMYLNLHIVQQGEFILIFDWKTIGSGLNVWYNIYDDSMITLQTSVVNIGVDDYRSDDTNFTMSECYNQIAVKDNFEDRDSLLGSFNESNDIRYYSNSKQLWFSEFISEGDGSSSYNAFLDWVEAQNTNFNIIDIPDYDGWYRNDYYFRWAYNPNWTLMYQGQNIEKYLEYDQNGNVVNQHRIMMALRQNRFMPALLAYGKSDNQLKYNNNSRLTDGGGVRGKISLSNYLVISVNGNEDDSNTEFSAINSAIKTACGARSGSDAISDSTGLVKFVGDEVSLSPADDSTNYIIFSGNIILNPVRKNSGTLTLPQSDKTTFKSLYDAIKTNLFLYSVSTIDMARNDDGARYFKTYYRCYDPTSSDEYFDPNSIMFYPFVDEDKQQILEYNYSAHWSNTDEIEKFPVLECMLKIGDKYLVETSAGSMKKPRYAWYTYNDAPTVNIDGQQTKLLTFSIGPNIDRGDKIIGKEYEICNTVDGRFNNNKGLAIPIKRSDAISGKIEFKIICPSNTIFNEITRRHPTLFRSTKFYDNYKNVLSHVSSIILKDFKIHIASDNNGIDESNENDDLVYYSVVNAGVVKKLDPIEFDLTTQPDSNTIMQYGLKNNVSNTNVINVKTNVSLRELTDVNMNETDIAEKLYINQYYEFYSNPHTIVESTINRMNAYPMLHKYRFNEFGTGIPISSEYNLMNNTLKIQTFTL